MNTRTKFSALVLSLVLAACGGGGGGSSPSPAPTPTPTPTPTPVTVPTVTIQSAPTTSSHAGVFFAAPIVVKVVDQNNNPISGVVPTLTPNDNGWVVNSGSASTAADGTVTYWWAPGNSATPQVSATYSGSTKVVTGTTTPWATNPNGLANNIFSTNPGNATGYQRDVTPQTEASGTYYSDIAWNQGYAGLDLMQDGTHLIMFSAWDITGHAATQVISTSGSTCAAFGGEGTGQRCTQAYPWTAGHTYRFAATFTPAADNSYNDIKVQFTDLTGGTTITIAVLRQFGTPVQTYVQAFTEDFALTDSDCFSVKARSATFGVPSYLTGSTWTPMTGLVYGDFDTTKYCANNTYVAASDGSITLNVGGTYQAHNVTSTVTLH